MWRRPFPKQRKIDLEDVVTDIKSLREIFDAFVFGDLEKNPELYDIVSKNVLDKVKKGTLGSFGIKDLSP